MPVCIQWSGLLAVLEDIALSGIEGIAGVVPYFTGAGAMASASSTSYGRGLWSLADAAALRTAGGLVIGTNVQAYSATLTSLAGASAGFDPPVLPFVGLGPSCAAPPPRKST